MNIYAEKGSKVIYTGRNGYDTDKEFANKYLQEGEIYIISFVDVGGWSSKVYLEGFTTVGFNSVHFEDLEDGS